MTQEMDLKDGSLSHFIVLQLPSGILVKALISDDSAQAVVHAQVTGGAPPPPEPVKEFSNWPLTDQEEGNVHVFGGEDETPSKYVEPPLSPAIPKSRIVRVEKDEWGYPIVRRTGAIDSNMVTGGNDPDEDGVGQL